MKFTNHSAVYFWGALGGAVLVLPLLVAQDQERQPINNPNFSSTVYQVKENSTGTFAHIYFPPGAHTKWHSHEAGQVILCEEGTCLNALKGGPIVELHAGETSYAPPGVPHWQGAASNAGGTQFNTQRGKITWMDAVTEEEYKAPTSRITIAPAKK
ncbi:MAG TPA: cupin domain-containing protein [Bryobacteraceae bacterium]|nr:cupin domain-containing protein [Bryobacteraceae bacterium]